MARPQKPIDAKLVGDLAEIGCTDTEIARLVGCSVDTLKRRFAEILDKGRETLKMKLRRAQIRAAIDNENVVMLIFLGKQYLGQSDKTETTIKQEDLDAAINTELERLAAAG